MSSRCSRTRLRKTELKRRNFGEYTCSLCQVFFDSLPALTNHTRRCHYITRKKIEAVESGAPEEETEDEPWLDGGNIEYLARTYVETCLRYLNEQYSGIEYKLVKVGNYQTVGISRARIYHLNFKAKANDGPVEMFFAQLRRTSEGDEVDCCVSLGPSEVMPHWKSAYLRDCEYCTYGVHHPLPGSSCDEKLLLGEPLYDPSVPEPWYERSSDSSDSD